MGYFDLFKPQTPMITPILPDAARQEIIQGRLPILRSNKIFLKGGENCHYIDKAIYEKRTVRKRYVRHTRNYSTPGLFKGTRHIFGGGHTDQVDNVQYTTHKGILYITNRRLILVGANEGLRSLNRRYPLHRRSTALHLMQSMEYHIYQTTQKNPYPQYYNSEQHGTDSTTQYLNLLSCSPVIKPNVNRIL